MSLPNKSPSNYAFDEFQLYFESAEKVTDRRLELGRTNSSFLILVIAGLSGAYAWAFDKSEIKPLVLGFITAVSFLGILFCWLWLRQIDTYKQLNGVKFKVLEEMADALAFSGYTSGITPAKPFVREWELLSKQNGLQSYKGSKTLRTTNLEIALPFVFMTFFVGMGIAAAAFLLRDLF